MQHKLMRFLLILAALLGIAVMLVAVAELLVRFEPVTAIAPHDDGPAALAAFQAAFPHAYQAIAVGRESRLDGR